MRNLLPSLSCLWLVDCPELESFPEGGLPSKLEGLGILRCKKLLIGNRMQWGLPTLTSLHLLSVDFEGCEQVVDSFPDEGLLPTTLGDLEIYSISKLDGKGFTQLTSLKELLIRNCPELRGLPDEGLPTSLSYLYILNCPLLEQRCQRERLGKIGPRLLTSRPFISITNVNDVQWVLYIMSLLWTIRAFAYMKYAIAGGSSTFRTNFTVASRFPCLFGYCPVWSL